MAAQVTSSIGRRSRLRRVQANATASLTVSGSARSKASTLGMKSKPDQMRMTAWLASATSNDIRTAGWDQAQTSEAINMTSKATWAAIQNRRREMPPRAGWTKTGPFGQAGATNTTSY